MSVLTKFPCQSVAGSGASRLNILMQCWRISLQRSALLFALFIVFWASGARAQTAEDIASHYVLGTGDRIAIQVFDEADLTMEALVSDSGVINYSYVGTLEVAGKTPLQIEEQITAILSDGYLNNPSVNVSIEEYRPFFINGEVRSPGGYPYQPGLTVDRAIALAGGLTDRASKRKMYLVKGDRANSKANKVRMNSSVEPGDIITINEGFF